MAATIPRRAIFRGHRVRIVDYVGDGRFRIVQPDDSYATVARSRLTFVR